MEVGIDLGPNPKVPIASGTHVPLNMCTTGCHKLLSHKADQDMYTTRAGVALTQHQVST